MDQKKIFLTQEGLDELKRELQELVKVKRPAVVERVSSARDMGDLAENSEYQAAREELSLIDGRIEELQEILKNAKVIQENTHGKGKKVQLGSKVTVVIGKKKEVFTLVGEWEADPENKKISHQSPLGKALLGRSVGEKVEVNAPAGKVVYTITDVE
jgi:transcription elongation factor GreA